MNTGYLWASWCHTFFISLLKLPLSPSVKAPTLLLQSSTAPVHTTQTKNPSWRNRDGGWTCCSSKVSFNPNHSVNSQSVFPLHLKIRNILFAVSCDSLFTFWSCCYRILFWIYFCASWKHNYLAPFIACWFCCCCFLCYTFLFIHLSSSQPSWGQINVKYTCLCVNASPVYTANQAAQSLSNSKKQFDSAESSHKT